VKPTDKHNYKTSREYTLLADRMERETIVCFCRYISSRDVCHTQFDGTYRMVNSRGFGYIWADSLEDFIRQCEQAELEWLIPNVHLTTPPKR
jgi:hypothetical protein